MEGFWKLMSRASKYRSHIALAILFNILLAVFTVISIPLITPFFQLLFDRLPEHVGEIAQVDRVTEFFSSLIKENGKQQSLIIVCGLIVGTFFLKNLFRYLSLYVMAPLRSGMVYDIRSELYNKYLGLPLEKIHSSRSGDFIARMTADVQEIEHSILKLIEVVFKAPLIIVGSIFYMIYLSPQLTLFVLILLVFTVFVIGGISRTLKKNSAKAQGHLANITSQVEESIYGARITKAFNGETFLKERFKKENESYRNLITKLLRRQELSSPLSEFLGVSIVAILMYYGSQLVFQQSLVPEAFFAFIFAFYQVIEPAKSFSTAYYNIQKGLAAVDRVDQVMDIASEGDKDQGKRVAGLKEGIEVKGLSFSYSEGEKVLDDVSLHVKKGETVAIVGPSGGGKSTLINVLMGFYPIKEGAVEYDGLSINDIHRTSLRSMLGLVSQNPILFHDTIAHNIAFGKKDIKPAEIEEAARSAFAHDFIKELPGGYDTHIGDKGVKLSGGQRQRLTIARAVLHNPDVLILDEATSALDSESELLVQQSLEKILENRTAIVIAHRLSTITKADKIIVLEGGKVVGQGTHETLLSSTPLYKKYVDMQTFN